MANPLNRTTLSELILDCCSLGDSESCWLAADLFERVERASLSQSAASRRVLDERYYANAQCANLRFISLRRNSISLLGVSKILRTLCQTKVQHGANRGQVVEGRIFSSLREIDIGGNDASAATWRAIERVNLHGLEVSLSDIEPSKVTASMPQWKSAGDTVQTEENVLDDRPSEAQCADDRAFAVHSPHGKLLELECHFLLQRTSLAMAQLMNIADDALQTLEARRILMRASAAQSTSVLAAETRKVRWLSSVASVLSDAFTHIGGDESIAHLHQQSLLKLQNFPSSDRSEKALIAQLTKSIHSCRVDKGLSEFCAVLDGSLGAVRVELWLRWEEFMGYLIGEIKRNFALHFRFFMEDCALSAAIPQIVESEAVGVAQHLTGHSGHRIDLPSAPLSPLLTHRDVDVTEGVVSPTFPLASPLLADTPAAKKKRSKYDHVSPRVCTWRSVPEAKDRSPGELPSPPSAGKCHGKGSDAMSRPHRDGPLRRTTAATSLRRVVLLESKLGELRAEHEHMKKECERLQKRTPRVHQGAGVALQRNDGVDKENVVNVPERAVTKCYRSTSVDTAGDDPVPQGALPIPTAAPQKMVFLAIEQPWGPQECTLRSTSNSSAASSASYFRLSRHDLTPTSPEKTHDDEIPPSSQPHSAGERSRSSSRVHLSTQPISYTFVEPMALAQQLFKPSLSMHPNCPQMVSELAFRAIREELSRSAAPISNCSLETHATGCRQSSVVVGDKRAEKTPPAGIAYFARSSPKIDDRQATVWA
jgi:hypothetical protein